MFFIQGEAAMRRIALCSIICVYLVSAHLSYESYASDDKGASDRENRYKIYQAILLNPLEVRLSAAREQLKTLSVTLKASAQKQEQSQEMKSMDPLKEPDAQPTAASAEASVVKRAEKRATVQLGSELNPFDLAPEGRAEVVRFTPQSAPTPQAEEEVSLQPEREFPFLWVKNVALVNVENPPLAPDLPQVAVIPLEPSFQKTPASQAADPFLKVSVIELQFPITSSAFVLSWWTPAEKTIPPLIAPVSHEKEHAKNQTSISFYRVSNAPTASQQTGPLFATAYNQNLSFITPTVERTQKEIELTVKNFLLSTLFLGFLIMFL
jgi:hypothetical protein